MDVYDHIPLRKISPDVIYLLESFSDDFFTDDTYLHLYGAFENLETAMHALNHLKNYNGSEIEVGQHLLVSSVKKNTLKTFRHRLISWERKDSTVIDERLSGATDGAFTLHDSGLRTHDVER